jgi:hypothetical protein
MVAAQTAEAEADCPHESEGQQPLQRCVFSADGAMISLVHKQWAETRTVAIGEPQEKRTADGEREIHVGQLSYFSRLADASTFTHLAEVEMQRRKVAEAKEVCAIMDGADWCQTFTDRYRPDAVRILDFPHAAEHVTKLLEALEHAGMHFPVSMLQRCLHVLKHRGSRPLLRMADRLGSDLAQHNGVHEHLDYLRKREALMQYPQFQSSGWPIGSGMVESANKNVVEARLKGTGMHWERTHVNPMLALRTAVCNDCWQEMWQKALKHHRTLQTLRRSMRAKPGASPVLAVGTSSSVESPPPSAATSKPFSSPARSPVAQPSSSCRPATEGKRQRAHHCVNASPRQSGEGRRDTCLCGTPLVRFKGHRPKQYCSDRCRQHAYRKRHTQTKPFPSSSHASASQRRKRAAVLRVRVSSHRSGGVRGDTCLFCGTGLVQSTGGRMREYCSECCRQRAHRERQAQAS